MKKLLTTLMVVAASAASAQTVDNWTASGAPVRNGTQELCWRDANWTPATAHPDCDGALKKPRVTATIPAVTPAPAPGPKPVAVKVTYQAESLFDFDKSVVKPAGQRALNDLVTKTANIKLEVFIVVGHTDSVGTDTYNQKLGLRRAEAVKAYLVKQGIETNRVYTESKGESKPVADNKTREGRAQNRRVEIEAVGTQK